MLLFSEIQGHKIILASAYTPNTDDPTFFGRLECKLNEMGDYPILMGGYFNQVMDNILDSSTPSQCQCRSVSVIQEICKASGLVDGGLFNPSFSPRLVIHLFISIFAISSIVSNFIGCVLLSPF